MRQSQQARFAILIGDLISYQDGRKGCTVIADKVGKP
jgi:hypothetical protein